MIHHFVIFEQITWVLFKELSKRAVIELLPLSSTFYVDKMSIKIKKSKQN